MRRIVAAAAVALAGCHSLLGIEDTSVGEDPDAGTPIERIGLDRVIIAEVIGPQLQVESAEPPEGLFVDIELIAEPIEAARLLADDRDAAGLGCVVLERAAGQLPVVANEGSVEISGINVSAPPCRHVDGRYLCAETRTSTPDPIAITNLPGSLASAELNGASPPFGATDVGRFLLLPGEPPWPIRLMTSDNEVLVHDPFSADRSVPGAEHRVAVGLGPSPVPTDVFAGGDVVSITKSNGAAIAGFTLETPAGAEGYRLDESSARPEALPETGPAMFTCTGVDGNCGAGATHVTVWARTTDVRADPMALSTILAPIAIAERELRCLFEGDDAVVSAEIMDVLRGGGTRRIAAVVARGSVAVTDDEQRPVALLAGFGHYGFTTFSSEGETCSPVFQDCSPSMRCTAVSEPGGGDAVNRCVADAPVSRGGSCEPRDPAVGGSTDDCTAGTSCSFNLCSDICDSEDVSCGNDQVCISLAGQELQVCRASCDVLTQTGCQPGEGCYVASGDGLCVEPVDPTRLEGESCMFLNDCEPGTQCSDVGTGPVCMRFCDTTLCDDGDGVPDQCGCSGCAADETCIPVSGAPSDVGFCARATDVGCDCGASPICPPM